MRLSYPLKRDNLIVQAHVETAALSREYREHEPGSGSGSNDKGLTSGFESSSQAGSLAEKVSTQETNSNIFESVDSNEDLGVDRETVAREPYSLLSRDQHNRDVNDEDGSKDPMTHSDSECESPSNLSLSFETDDDIASLTDEVSQLLELAICAEYGTFRSFYSLLD
jgi:hypothetical protein